MQWKNFNLYCCLLEALPCDLSFEHDLKIAASMFTGVFNMHLNVNNTIALLVSKQTFSLINILHIKNGEYTLSWNVSLLFFFYTLLSRKNYFKEHKIGLYRANTNFQIHISKLSLLAFIDHLVYSFLFIYIYVCVYIRVLYGYGQNQCPLYLNAHQF